VADDDRERAERGASESKMTITAVTFDCWGTLITDSGFEKAMASRVEAIADACGVSQEAAAELLDRAWRVHHDEWLNARQYGSSGMARFCTSELGITDDAVCARLTEAMEEAGRLGSQSGLEGAVETLQTLRTAGIRTALVCDAGFTPGRIVRDFLDRFGLLEHLEFCAFSNEVGTPKPDPRIFHVALAAIDTVPEQAAHVGDLLRTDVFGARSIGMKTVRITQISDDAARGFSWDANAAFAGHLGDEERPDRGPSPYDDADEIVASHAELPAALRRLGADI
jgi:putative hydrolase of the HAD superfamily